MALILYLRAINLKQVSHNAKLTEIIWDIIIAIILSISQKYFVFGYALLKLVI